MRAWAVVAVAAAVFLAPGEARAATTLPTGFQETTVFSGLRFPTAVRFSPDGRVFVAEKSGIIKVFPSLTSTTPTIFADLSSEVTDFSDRGLLGIALDPNFPSAPYVYALYTRDAPIGGNPPTWGDDCPTPPGPTTDGCVVSGRLVRLTATGNVATATQTLVDGWCQQFDSHSVGDLRFGPDGALYASAGEGASYTFADYGQVKNLCNDPTGRAGDTQTPPSAEGGALRAQSMRRLAGDPVVLNGAIIRVDPATGLALPNNPNAGAVDANARRIVAYGFRNPYRFTFRPGTNELWVGNVGWTDWEAIDRVANPLNPVIGDYGWPCYEGNGKQSAYQSIGLTLCTNLYSSGVVIPPYFTYSHTDQVVPGESCPSGGSAVSGLAFYNGGSYPTAYNGALFFADYARSCIWVMMPGANGQPDPTKISTFGAGASVPVDLEIGPNGDLFYVDINLGTVREIKYLGGNRPPVANATATPTNGSAPLTVTFDGSASSDPDTGDTITYAWDLNGDGVFDDSTAAKPTFTYQPGTYNVRLRVTDNHLASTTSSTIVITSSNTPPVPIIQTPLSTLTWKVGDPITFSGSASDAQDGSEPASRLIWTLLLQHCPSNCHTHIVQTFNGVSGGMFNAPDHDYPSYLTLQLTATDSTGASVTTSVDLQPQTVVLNFDSVPHGLSLAVGPTSSTTPFSRTVIKGSANSISATTPQGLAGTIYDFSSWSDGGAQTHNIVAPANASYTATYVVSGNQGDTTPPTVSLTAPSPNATVSGTVNVSANASDDVGVTSVQFQLDGANLGSPVTTAPYTTSWNPAGLSNGSHTLTAIARDAAGHATTSAPVSVYVATGLVGAWAFDEGTGASVADSSGSGNNGTATATTWSTSGKYGNALTFDGTSSIVTVPDSNSLDLATASTLEAWVFPTALGTGWRTVLFKEQTGGMVYSLYANNGERGAHPLGQVNIGGEKNAEGTATLPLNAWSHLAAAWDGTTLRLYVNGTLAGSVAVSGSLINSSGALRMGGNTIWKEWFAGRIDEARVYNRALTQAEIQSDMNRPIKISGVDTTPPSISVTAPAAGSLVGGNVPLTASASDDIGVTGVQFKVDGQAVGSEIAAPPYSFTWASTTSGTHTITATAKDAAGNTTTSAPISITVDNTPPTATVTAPTAGSTVSGTVTVTATATDNTAVAGVQFKIDGANVGFEDTTSPYSVTWDTTSATNASHAITAVARDTAGNTATSAGVIVTVSNGVTPPPPTGLVAAYGLNETTGTTAADASGKTNTGTARDVTWSTSGKYGGAATFNGTTSWISVADANTLDLTNAMTLEAWVFPTALGTGWRTVVFKEKTGGMVYSLYANDSTQRALTQLNIGGELNTWSAAQLPLNTWTHLAGTWDGTTLKLYVNGALASSRPVTGTLTNSTGPLKIGGNAIWNEWFAGRIDEVRVYNRVLSQSEVQADMAAPVH